MANASKKVSVKTPPGIASYANLIEPRADQKGKMKYSVAVLIDKSRSKELDGLRKAALEVATAKWGADKAKFILEKAKYPLIRDGDQKTDDEGKVDPVYKGKFFISCRTDRKPGIVDASGKNEIFTDDEVYSGCMIIAAGVLFPYEAEGNRGVSFGLNAVQVVKKLPRLDGRKPATETFDEYVDPDADPTA